MSRNALASGLNRQSDASAADRSCPVTEYEFAPKGRDSIAQGAALGHESARRAQPQRGDTHVTFPLSHAPLGLADVRCSVTQG